MTGGKQLNKNNLHKLSLCFHFIIQRSCNLLTASEWTGFCPRQSVTNASVLPRSAVGAVAVVAGCSYLMPISDRGCVTLLFSSVCQREGFVSFRHRSCLHQWLHSDFPTTVMEPRYPHDVCRMCWTLHQVTLYDAQCVIQLFNHTFTSC